MSPSEPERPGPDSEPTIATGGDQPAADAPAPEPPTEVTPPPPPPPPPPAPAAPVMPPTQVTPPSPPPPPPPEPVTPTTTSSGLPNPYGLPEIAVERPEVGVGAAFAGGLVLAMILRRFAR